MNTTVAKQNSIDSVLFSGLGLLAVRIIQGFIYWGGGEPAFYLCP